MAWVARGATRTAYLWDDDADPRRHHIGAQAGVRLGYATDPDGEIDAAVNASPVRVNVANVFDGWRITENGWHYALGKDIANHGQEDGWVGFGGRRG